MELLKGIKNIVFDLGGVLLNINPQLTIDAFANLGMKQLIGNNGLSYDNEVFYKMEKGQLSPDEFREGVSKLLPEKVSFNKIDDAWTAMLLDFPEIRVNLLKRLGEDYNIYLFSNTNAIHVQKFHEDFRLQHGFEVSELFVKDFYSNEIGFRKPTGESFAEIVRLSGIKPEESLFIDDSNDNVSGAISENFKGYWLKPNEKIEVLFADYL